MHRLPSTSAVARLRTCAFFLILTCILAPSVLILIGYSVLREIPDLIPLAGILAAITILTGIIQAILAAKARCPLCMTPPLAGKRCSKHRHARTLFGSYRLRAASSIVARGHFRCPYCNEPTVMEARQRRS